MATKRLSISAFVLGALLGLPVTAARADKPTTEREAQDAAEKAHDQAEHYRSLGGVGYKAGLVQRAEADEVKYDAMARELGPEGAQQTGAPAETQTPNPTCLPTKPPVDATCEH